MKKMLIMLALVLGVSAMAEEAATTTKAEDAKTGATVSYTHLDVYKRQLLNT